MIDSLRAWLTQELAAVLPATDLWQAPALPRFARILPYHQYDQVSGLYGLPDGNGQEAIGFLLEALPQEGVSEQLERSLQEMPSMLAPGNCMQVTLYADPDVRGQLGRYCRLRPGPKFERAKGVHRKLARRRFDHLLAQSDELAPRDHRLFFSATARGSLDQPDKVAAMQKLRQTIVTVLTGCSIPTLAVPPEELINLVAGLLNPHSASRRRLGYSPEDLISEQCVLRDTEVEVGIGDIRLRGDGRDQVLAVLGATQYPAMMRLAGMQGLLGDPSRPNLKYSSPFLITQCLRSVDPEEARMLVSLRSARSASNAKSMMAWLMPSYYRRQHEDWQVCAEALEGGGNLVLLAHQVVVQAKPAGIAEAVESARSVWRACGFTLSSCEYLQAQGLLAALPLGLTPGLAADMRKLGWLGRKTTHNAAHSMPVVAEWKGTRTPALLMVGRRGQLMNLDIFDSVGNHNAIIAGASGSGKSVLLNEIATNSLGLGAQVWVLDIGRSYQLTCEYLGGEFIQFGPGTKMSLNPFSAVVNINDDMRLLNPLFAQMVAPRGNLGDYERARLEEALLETWERYGKDATPTCVRESLLRLGADDARIADMAAMLSPFCVKGVHGHWFDGPATVDFCTDYVVLELEELKGWPELQVVIFLQLLFSISQRMYGNRARRKLVLVDEAWELMRGRHVAEFIEHGYRRSRKYNGAFLSASQSVADFHANEAGRAALANSDWLMLLSQKSEEVAHLVESGQLTLSSSELAMVRSLRTQPGRFSEVFVRGTGFNGAVGRLTVDDYSQLLYSTRAEDHQAIAAARERGSSLVEALEDVIAQRQQNGG